VRLLSFNPDAVGRHDEWIFGTFAEGLGGRNGDPGGMVKPSPLKKNP